MYKELSSDDESFGPPLFPPEGSTARNSSRSPSRDDDEFTPASTGSPSKKGVPKKRKKDPDKPPKPRKPRVPKNPSDSPSKTHVNRFKQNLGEMVRTASESPFIGGGASAMARVRVSHQFHKIDDSHGQKELFNLLQERNLGLPTCKIVMWALEYYPHGTRGKLLKYKGFLFKHFSLLI
jgi:hypothetical protein